MQIDLLFRSVFVSVSISKIPVHQKKLSQDVSNAGGKRRSGFEGDFAHKATDRKSKSICITFGLFCNILLILTVNSYENLKLI